jgi:hypothetical protein
MLAYIQEACQGEVFDIILLDLQACAGPLFLSPLPNATGYTGTAKIQCQVVADDVMLRFGSLVF